LKAAQPVWGETDRAASALRTVLENAPAATEPKGDPI
jgi:hypothetical protein